MMRWRFSRLISSLSSNIVHPGLLTALFLVLLQCLFSSSGGAAAAGVEEFYPGERDALIQLRDILTSSSASSNVSYLHGNWTGPPCYKNQSRWAGIGCSNSHVNSLVLEGLRLTASLPTMLLQNVTFLTKLSFRSNSLYGPLPDVSNLLDLEFLFLSDNQFSGSIPAAYAQLPKLTTLELQQNSLRGIIPPFDQNTLTTFNVSHNQLTGPIPQTPALLRFSKSSYDFNSNLCGRPLQVQCPASPPKPPPPPPPANGLAPPNPPAEKRKGQLRIWSLAVIAAAAALVPLFVIICFLCCYKRIRVTKPKSEQPGNISRIVYPCITTVYFALNLPKTLHEC